jgi:hypothetical protein
MNDTLRTGQDLGHQREMGFTRNERMEADVQKFGCHDSVPHFLRDELVVSEQIKRWGEVDGVIYLTVTLDKPMAGNKWIPWVETKGDRAGDCAKSVLRSKKFKSSVAGTYEIVILKSSLFEDNDRTTQNIRAKADEMKLVKPNADIACLIREQFTDKEIEAMGIKWIVAMHEPIEDSAHRPRLIAVCRYGNSRWLAAYRCYPGDVWACGFGFAFFPPQVP